ncbi:BTH_I0359 family protein [Candidatus Vallotiella sp. (ex Adelges kitamiensis)]|uniref:BTH_I0359 family protein n=1 Tax=Candidatus Vallotiella sp. (ex Adelges kitamiensis) TaxID=2864217 RepID=UPI001CE32DB7|nr:DUF3567 domain-containing protein [Candidatus Vallotia sp. (ex Adelges kitamiensis)]
MQMIYNSPNYCVVEFAPQAEHGTMLSGGFEIVNKNTQREIFIEGLIAARFRKNIHQLLQKQPSLEEVDEFLEQFNLLMNQPVVIH